MTDTNESMREFTRTINSIQTKDAAPLTKKKKQSLAKRLMQLLGPLKTHPPAKVSEDAKTPYVPTVDYINNPKMKYTPPSVLRRLAAIKKRQASALCRVLLGNWITKKKLRLLLEKMSGKNYKSIGSWIALMQQKPYLVPVHCAKHLILLRMRPS